MKRRIFALMLCVCLIIAMFSGCGKKKTVNEGSNDKIKVFVNIKNRPDCSLVSQELSKITREKLGFDVEFMFGYNQDKISLMLASNEPMDIGLTNYETFVDSVRQNAYVDITDKVKKDTPELYATIPEELWEGSKVDGRNWAVPTYKEMAEIWTVLVDEEIVVESGVDVSKIKELKDIEPILETLKKDPERAGFEILSTTSSHMNMVLKSKYDVVYEDFVVERENPEKVVHFMETNEYKEFVTLMNEWYKKGYIAKDIATRTDYDSYHDSGKFGVSPLWYSPCYEYTMNSVYNKKFIPIHLSPAIKTNASMQGNSYAIFSKSKNIDKALKFLELWNTDPEVKNLITYGIEGKHYELVDGKVKYTEGALDLYKMTNSSAGNMMISYLLETDPDDKYEQFKQFNDSALTSTTLGFFPNVDPIKSQIGACANVISEYNSLLCCGVLDPDEYVGKMRKALKSSGVDKVKKELQKQYDEWRKK